MKTVGAIIDEMKRSVESIVGYREVTGRVRISITLNRLSTRRLCQHENQIAE